MYAVCRYRNISHAKSPILHRAEKASGKFKTSQTLAGVGPQHLRHPIATPKFVAIATCWTRTVPMFPASTSPSGLSSTEACLFIQTTGPTGLVLSRAEDQTQLSGGAHVGSRARGTALCPCRGREHPLRWACFGGEPSRWVGALRAISRCEKCRLLRTR